MRHGSEIIFTLLNLILIAVQLKAYNFTSNFLMDLWKVCIIFGIYK